mmetsp:Transcript_3522/g.10273  ORF Transcript_3522/g.10273 Transcript_3522/m.10273 type:complete len:161 (-) Transcript_3522:5-487(-)
MRTNQLKMSTTQRHDALHGNPRASSRQSNEVDREGEEAQQRYSIPPSLTQASEEDNEDIEDEKEEAEEEKEDGGEASESNVTAVTPDKRKKRKLLNPYQRGCLWNENAKSIQPINMLVNHGYFYACTLVGGVFQRIICLKSDGSDAFINDLVYEFVDMFP